MSAERILIIDDEENIRRTMQMALEAEGYVVAGATDGLEGVRRFREREGWDLVLLDQRMPGMDGLEVLRRIREIDPEAKVVMVTAYATIDLAVDAMRAGATDFLRKPFTPAVLRGAVRGALDAQPPPDRNGIPRRRRVCAEEGLPAGGRAAARRADGATGPPLVTFRTLNGFSLWPVEVPEEEETTDALRIRRIFEVQAPNGGRSRTAVDVTTAVQEMIRQELGRELPAFDPLWETICRYMLSNELWRNPQLPPDTLVVYRLSREELSLLTNRLGSLPRDSPE
jgi:CheY-like chemotaxis protein